MPLSATFVAYLNPGDQVSCGLTFAAASGDTTWVAGKYVSVGGVSNAQSSYISLGLANRSLH